MAPGCWPEAVALLSGAFGVRGEFLGDFVKPADPSADGSGAFGGGMDDVIVFVVVVVVVIMIVIIAGGSS